MSQGIPSDPTVAWPAFSMTERRILGVLVEKAKTTPDVYPMSLNSMMTGANQKSNREPVLNMSEEDVERTLESLQPKGHVTRIQGGRVERWRHNLYDVWSVNKVELAILAELLLRGPQTEGELRLRASRMEPIDDLESLRAALVPLADRKLVLFLGEVGRRGTLITHGFHADKEIELLRARAPVEEVAASMPVRETIDADRVAKLETELQAVRQEVAELRTQLQALRTALGA